jgi:copper chaperone NosL
VKIPTISRVLVLVGALLLGGMYVLPLWRIDLGAPQYPEGLGLLIRINTVEGQKPQDLANINSLNHYIGMQAIEPEAIPELRYMPWVLGGLIALGLAAAIVARRRMVWAWLGALAGAGALGLFDFWRWGYDYGHNLDPQAIIKVPGLTYSPPLIGTKQLLNFTATSLPASGAYLAGAAFLLGVAAIWLSCRHMRSSGLSAANAGSGGARSRAIAALLILGVAVACTSSALPVRYGEDACAHCRMVITDPRFGGSVVTTKGRTEQFDSMDCLLAFVRGLPESPREVLVADFRNPGQMLSADDAVFTRSEMVHGPMGATWIAELRGSDEAAARGEREQLSFADLLDMSEPAVAGAAGPHHHGTAAP